MFAMDGVQGLLQIDLGELTFALIQSIFLAIGVAILSELLSLCVAYLGRHFMKDRVTLLLEAFFFVPASLSTVVLSLALMNSYMGGIDFFRGTLIGPLIVQTLLCLPIVTRTLIDGYLQIPDSVLMISRSFGATPFQRFFYVEWPSLKSSLLLAFGWSALFSLGEVGSVLVFSSEAAQTVPALIFRTMNRYAFQEASGIALVLALLMVTFTLLVEDRYGK